MMYDFKCVIKKIIDGDTVDCNIDLGMDHWMHNARIRIYGIDAPESRTTDTVEKIFGFYAKNLAASWLLESESLILISKEYNRGKYGRILGDFLNGTGDSLAEFLIHNHAAAHWDDSKEVREREHLANRHRLIESGSVVLPDEG